MALFPNHIGEIFRQIRIDKGYTIAHFEEIGMARSVISKFERGRSSMRLDRAIEMLDEMDTTLDEFEHYVMDYSSTVAEQLIHEIEEARLTQDVSKLGRLFSMASSQHYLYISLAAKMSYTQLDDFDVERLTDYFYELEYWGYKELCLLELTMWQLRSKDLVYLINSLWTDDPLRKSRLIKNSRHRTRFIILCCDAVCLLAFNNKQANSRYFLNRLETHDLIDKMSLRNLFNMTKGYWTYCFKDPEEGKKMIVQGLEILEEIASPQIASYYRYLYGKYVN